MSVIWRFVKATVVGGFLFLVPLILLLAVAAKGIELAKKVVVPIVAHLPDVQVGGVALATIAAAAFLLVLALAVGLFAQTSLGRRAKDWMESTILGKIPAYSILRGMLEPSDASAGALPALAWVEESWVYALIMEVHPDGHRTVFIPGAPNPLSGSLYFLPENRVRPLDVPIDVFMKQIRRIGVGSKDVVAGSLGSPPS